MGYVVSFRECRAANTFLVPATFAGWTQIQNVNLRTFKSQRAFFLWNSLKPCWVNKPCSWYITKLTWLYLFCEMFHLPYFDISVLSKKFQQANFWPPEVMAYNRDSGRYLVQLLPPAKGAIGPGPIFQGTEVPPISKLVLLQNLRPAVERTLKPPLKEAHFI